VTATSTAPAAPSAASGPAHRRRSRIGRQLALVSAAVLSVAALVVWLYASAVHANLGDSDGATVVLEAQAMIHGHLLLQGWALSLDSFWLVDAPVYVVAIAVAGTRESLLFAGPAIIATLVIVMGIVMAREDRRGAAAVAGGFTVVALLAFPTHTMASFFLRGPLHVGTALWALVAFWAIRRGRFGFGWIVAVVFVTAGMLGDFQMVAYGLVPLGLAGLVAMLRQRSWRGGIAQVSAAVASAVIDEVGRKVVKTLGGFTVGATNPLASRHAILTNAKHAITYSLDLIGARGVHVAPGSSPLLSDPGVPAWLQDVHIVAAAIMLLAFLAALASLIRGMITGTPQVSTAGVAGASDKAKARWRLDDMLVIATFAPPVVYVGLALTSDPEYTRYLTAGVIFASILAGRVVAQYWPKLRSPWLTRGVAAAGVAATMCFAASTGYTLAQAEPARPDSQLVAWLETHHLHNGVGDYWSASISTVTSQGDVTIRPVVSDNDGTLRRYLKQSAESWYSKSFQFFVYDTGLPWGSDNTVSATKTWGAPEHTYSVGPYRVLVWPRPLVLNPNPSPES
jgi:hypothetical protein